MEIYYYLLLLLNLNTIRTGFFTDLFSNNEIKNAELNEGSRKNTSVIGLNPIIDENMQTEWIVIGRYSCPFTRKAVILIKSQGGSVVFLDEKDDLKDTLDELQTTLRHKSAPTVIHNGIFIGGFEQTLQYFGKKNEDVHDEDFIEEIDSKRYRNKNRRMGL